MSTSLMDIDEFTEYLGVAKSSVYSSRSRGDNTFPPSIKIGRHLRWRKASVDAWLDEREKESQNS